MVAPAFGGGGKSGLQGQRGG